MGEVMKGRRVRRITTHIGVQLTGMVKNSVSADAPMSCEMEMLPMGVYIKHKSMERIIPYANIQAIDLYPDDAKS